MKSPGFVTVMGLLLAGICGGLPAQDPKGTAPARQSDRPDDEKAIRDAGTAFVRAFDAGDVGAIMALFADDAEVIDERGHAIRGRDAISALFASSFEANPGATIRVETESIRFPGPDAALEEGRETVIPAKARAGGDASGGAVGGAPHSNRYSVLFVRRDGRWLQSIVRELPDRGLTPHDRLEPLAWLVGEWVDEGGESVVFTTIRWSEDGNYLLDDFTVQIAGRPAMKGSRRIGWDPLTRRIKSWVFDSEGGHGEAFWARDGDRWLVKASGVHPDGRTATATHVYTLVSKDVIRWKSIERTVDDRVEPDIPELVMVRKPPRPRQEGR
jgi:uncharacterized protein (TIGR02246 family)